MAKLSINGGSTSVTLNIWCQDSSSTTGQGLSGLVFNTSGLTAYYALPAATPVAITLATLASATAAFSSGGFFELDSVHMKGLYRFDIPNAAIASGRFSTIYFYGATNLAPCVLEIDLQANVGAINGVSASAVTTIKAVQGLTTADTIATYTGNTPQTGDAFAQIGVAGVGLTNLGDTRIANLDTTVSSRLATSGYTAPTNLTAAQIATGIWQDTTAGDFTAASSVGKSIMNGVALGTGLTINSYTGNTPQTGDSFARIGSAGVGLTNLGDTRIANLDATVSSRSTYSGGAVASVTGNVGGSVGSVTANVNTNANATETAIKAKTDNLPASPAAVSDIPTAVENCDTLLKRDWTAIVGSPAARSVWNALRFLRNRFSTSATPGVVSVYDETDTVVVYTKTVVTSAASEPIIEG